jgi:hypothetical protein
MGIFTEDMEDRVRDLLETYSLEELLEMSDVTVYELVLRLVQDGTIELPAVEPL